MHHVIEPSVHYFGTPVVLLSTLNADGTTNLSPMSSAWALGDTYVLGLGREGRAYENLVRTGEVVLNLVESHLSEAVERIAPTTGADPVPAHKRDRYRTVHDKWRLAGLTPTDSDLVAPQRVVECGVQIEATVRQSLTWDTTWTATFVEVLRVHARDDLVVPGTSHVDLERWSPLYYTFRHYFAQGEELGHTFKAEY